MTKQAPASNKSKVVMSFFVILLSLFGLIPVFCKTSAPSGDSAQASARPIRVLLHAGPKVLNPRRALDAESQRIGALLFAGLTRMDENLQPKPDLASHWSMKRGGLEWAFTPEQDRRDHAGNPIRPKDLVECLENYRIGEPRSPLAAAFPTWIGTSLTKSGEILFRFSEPDFFFDRNASLLRFFRSENAQSACAEPVDGSQLVGSGPYGRPISNTPPEHELFLSPFEASRSSSIPPLHLIFARDESTRAFLLLRGDVDAAQNAFALSKTHWLRSRYSSELALLQRDGVNVDYLAFNLRNSLTAHPSVRKAVAHAIPVPEIIEKFHAGLSSPAQSFLSPLLRVFRAKALPSNPALQYSPQRAIRLLDEAGFKPQKDGIRLTLKYRTTTSLIGIEKASLFQDALKKIGIQLVLEVVEPAVFFDSLKTADFHLYSSRWVGVADPSIYHLALHSTQPRNRIGYRSPSMDHLLENLRLAGDLDRIRRSTALIEQKMAEDLPYFPLWYWSNVVILRKDLTGLRPDDLSLSGALEPLSKLRWEGAN